MSYAVSIPSWEGVCGVCRILSSIAFLSSAWIFKYSRACASFLLRSGGLSPRTSTTRKSIVCSTLFLSQTRVTWPFCRIFWLPYVLLLLLVFETFKLGNNWLTKLLGTVLQVEDESICALTIFDFPSRTRCKWATNFFAHSGVALHSATNSSLSA